jgi:hypothetical protein
LYNPSKFRNTLLKDSSQNTSVQFQSLMPNFFLICLRKLGLQRSRGLFLSRFNTLMSAPFSTKSRAHALFSSSQAKCNGVLFSEFSWFTLMLWLKRILRISSRPCDATRCRAVSLRPSKMLMSAPFSSK